MKTVSKRRAGKQDGNNKRAAGDGFPSFVTSQQWEARLMSRRYHFPGTNRPAGDLAARIHHGGKAWWFALGSSETKAATAKAQRIYREIIANGWNASFEKYSRELVIGFEWSANPVMWTYTTVHTMVEEGAMAGGKAGNGKTRPVLVAEEDAGIRLALEWCVNQHAEFTSVPCEKAEKLEGMLEKHKPCLVLLNRVLSRRVGLNTSRRIAPIQQGVQVLTYGVAAEGDELFVSTPGGAEGYMLKRVHPERVLEPLISSPGPLDLWSEDLLPRVRGYFKGLLLPGPDHGGLGTLGITQREHEVLALMCRGCVDKEIAGALGISAWTVHGHIKSIFERLKVRTRTEAVIRYLEK